MLPWWSLCCSRACLCLRIVEMRSDAGLQGYNEG